MQVSPKKQSMTSYGGIIRIRLRVEVIFLSACLEARSPVLSFIILPIKLSFVKQKKSSCSDFASANNCF